jgi:hypothetical protein
MLGLSGPRASTFVAALDDAAPGTLAVAVPGLVAHRAAEVLPLASVGKVLLLAEPWTRRNRWTWPTPTTAADPGC